MPSSPPARWSDLAGAPVGIWGFGVEGRANLRKLRSLGTEPLVVDDEPSREDEVPVLATADGGLEALYGCRFVVKSPGISRYRADVGELERRGVAVVGGLGLWMEEMGPGRVLMVTGTKGKSTTVSIMGHLLKGLGYRTFVGGNLGMVPYDPEAAPGDFDWWVIETSSYQVLDLWSGPRIVAVTSLSPDHLNWHADRVDRYFADKLSLCELPGVAVAVLNGCDAELRERQPLLPRARWVGQDEARGTGWSDALGLRGEHNRMNAAIARACLLEAGVPEAADSQTMERAAGEFVPLPSRLQTIGRIGDVEFVDDSLSTNVLPTIAALDSFGGRRVALLVGGFDRGIDYGPLAEYLCRRPAPVHVMTLPDNGWRIRAALCSQSLPSPLTLTLALTESKSLEDGVRDAFAWARPDGVVLLSPAAPSFGRFADYRDRANAFRRAMKECAANS
jgi:UDP-N-acetylmuramoylalanine--D-glutamate ligase